MNVTSTSWQDFCLLYYDQAMASARYHLGKMKSAQAAWDCRMDEDALAVDAVMEALQKAFVKYDPARGASISTFLSRLVHNELADALEKEIRRLAACNCRDMTDGQEAEYTFKEMVTSIPEKAMEQLIVKLRAAILRLSPVDQSILGFFMEDPKTFVERSVRQLGVTADYVSVHKNRALAKLPALMGMDAKDYFDLYEEHQFAGITHYHISFDKFTECQTYNNPVCPQFDLDGTVMRLFHAINSIR